MPIYLEGRVEIVCDDITSLYVDAIVNAANSSLLGGGGWTAPFIGALELSFWRRAGVSVARGRARRR